MVMCGVWEREPQGKSWEVILVSFLWTLDTYDFDNFVHDVPQEQFNEEFQRYLSRLAPRVLGLYAKAAEMEIPPERKKIGGFLVVENSSECSILQALDHKPPRWAFLRQLTKEWSTMRKPIDWAFTGSGRYRGDTARRADMEADAESVPREPPRRSNVGVPRTEPPHRSLVGEYSTRGRSRKEIGGSSHPPLAVVQEGRGRGILVEGQHSTGSHRNRSSPVWPTPSVEWQVPEHSWLAASQEHSMSSPSSVHLSGVPLSEPSLPVQIAPGPDYYSWDTYFDTAGTSNAGASNMGGNLVEDSGDSGSLW